MSRNDRSDRNAFREYVRENIEEGRSPSFEFLTNEEGGWHDQCLGWRDTEGNIHDKSGPGFHSNEGIDPGWVDTPYDAGHTTSSLSGQNAYAIEDRSSNRSDGARFERQGIILEKPTIEIEHNSINRDLAQNFEDRGLLKEGVVAEAPAIEGWTHEAGIIGRNEETTLETSTEFSTNVDGSVSSDLALDPNESSNEATNDQSVADDAFTPVDLALDPQSELAVVEEETADSTSNDTFSSVDLDPDVSHSAFESTSDEASDQTANETDLSEDSSTWDNSETSNSEDSSSSTDSSSTSEASDSAASESDASHDAGTSDAGDGADGGD